MLEILAIGSACVAAYVGLNKAADHYLGTVKLTVPNPVEPDRYAAVLEAMRGIGSPNLRAVRVGPDAWCCIEGSHRVAAALELGLPIHIIEISPDTLITEHDAGDVQPDGSWIEHEGPVTAGSLCEWKWPMHYEMSRKLIVVQRLH